MSPITEIEMLKSRVRSLKRSIKKYENSGNEEHALRLGANLALLESDLKALKRSVQ